MLILGDINLIRVPPIKPHTRNPNFKKINQLEKIDKLGKEWKFGFRIDKWA
jgi:hypothetical protein